MKKEVVHVIFPDHLDDGLELRRILTEAGVATEYTKIEKKYGRVLVKPAISTNIRFYEGATAVGFFISFCQEQQSQEKA